MTENETDYPKQRRNSITADERELVVIEFNRTTGETKYIPLVVVDGKVVMAAEEGE